MKTQIGLGLALGAGIALLISFSYYGVLKTGQALGYNGNLPPPDSYHRQH